MDKFPIRKPHLEKCLKKVPIETAGYVSAERRITELLRAGGALETFRKEQYDSTDGTEPEIDPTRKPGFDMAEASLITRSVEEKVQKHVKLKNEEKKVKKPEKASPEAPGQKDEPLPGVDVPSKKT